MTAAECGINAVTVTVTTFTWGEEVTWHIDDGQVFGPYANNGVFTEMLCLEPGVAHTLNYIDSYGDGWSGGTIAVEGYVAPIVVAGAGGTTDFTVAAVTATECTGASSITPICDLDADTDGTAECPAGCTDSVGDGSTCDGVTGCPLSRVTPFYLGSCQFGEPITNIFPPT
jgi:hypothetical protein